METDKLLKISETLWREIEGRPIPKTLDQFYFQIVKRVFEIEKELTCESEKTISVSVVFDENSRPITDVFLKNARKEDIVKDRVFIMHKELSGLDIKT